jgi:hypothetical protein
MRYIALRLPLSLSLLLATPSIVVAQENPFVGTWHSTYTDPFLKAQIDDTLVLNADGSFKETEHANNLTSVVTGKYTRMPNNILHLVAEQSEPKVPLSQLPPEDMRYQFVSPTEWTADYSQNVRGKDATIHQTFQRVP